MISLIDKLIQEAGLTHEQAYNTISIMVAHLKAKLPPTLANNLEAMLLDNNVDFKEESIQEKAADLAEATKDRIEDFAEQAKDKLSDAAEKAEVMAKDALEKLKGMFGNDK